MIDLLYSMLLSASMNTPLNTFVIIWPIKGTRYWVWCTAGEEFGGPTSAIPTIVLVQPAQQKHQYTILHPEGLDNVLTELDNKKTTRLITDPDLSLIIIAI